MPQTQSQTGRFGTATVLGVFIPITTWTAKVRKAFAPSTDSNNYDAVTGQTWTSQQPGVVGMDGTIGGNFDFSGTIDGNFIQKFKTDGPYAIALGLTRTTTFASCNADFSDVDVSVTIDDANMITWSATWKSNGVVTLP